MDYTLSSAIAPEIAMEAIAKAVRIALEEDIGSGDLTARLLPETQLASATIISREPAVLCGIPWVHECFSQLDPKITIEWQVAEGDVVQAGQTICQIQGNARAMLTGERCALNFLQTLSAT
ncbi:MAG TPA: nicotinate-nucleotide diphosphorylase (carboxylating), partial [Methylophilaceae bacterium]|nr:nicotinate-nucleotide diphosphorylase (carboxylating) [Methylophilaceae bacterium]